MNKSIKHTLLFLLCTAGSCFGLKAQRLDADLFSGYTIMPVKWETFEQFRTSFNAVNQSTLKKELPAFGYAQGYTIGAQQRYGVFYIGLQFDKLFSKATADYNYSESRKFLFKTWLLSTELGFAAHAKNFYIGPVTGLVFGMNKVNSSYIYRDGTESFGSERILNGFYSAIVVKGTYGIKAGIDFSKFFGMYASAMYLPKGQIVNTQLRDLSTAKTLNIYGTTAGSIPTDYYRFLNTSNNYDYGDAYVMDDFSGLRFSLGLRLTVGNGK